MNGGLLIEKLNVRTGTFHLRVDEATFGPGQLTFVVGPSGAGKSTLLNTIGGFLPAESGEILYDGKSLLTLPPERRRAASVFQRPGLFPHLNVTGNVEFGLKVQKVEKRERARRVEECLAQLEISDLRNRKVAEISGGQAQRVALARALVVEFPILLLDEPFGALDERLRELCLNVVEKFVTERKVSALLVSHEREDWLRGRRCLRIADGIVSPPV